MTVQLVLYAVLTLVLLWIISLLPGFVRWHREYRKLCRAVEQFPGEPTHWFWGTMHLFPGPDQKGLDFTTEMATKYVKCFRFYNLFQPCIAVLHPETVNAVLQTSVPKDKKGTLSPYRLLLPWIGDGLITSNGEKWHRNRRLLTPVFHFAVLKPYCKIYNHSADKLVSKLKRQASAGKGLEIVGPVLACTLETVMKCAFSYEGDIQSEMESGDNTYINTVSNLASMIMDRYYHPYCLFDFIYYKLSEGKKFRRFCNIAHKTAGDVIARRKANRSDDKLFSENKCRDFLDIMLSARDEDGRGLSDQEIREEVDTFLFAGHDTTASAISWLLYNLASHPDIQAKARKEVDALFDDKHSNEYGIKIEDLTQLEYVTQCIKESMRLHTVVMEIWRKLDKDLEIDGKILPAGTVVDINLYGLHHNPHVWGPDANVFNPERFSAENRKNMDPFAFVPFSAGPRNCIGQNFALNEIKVVISKILRSFILEVDSTHKTEPAMHITLHAQDGIWLNITEIIN